MTREEEIRQEISLQLAGSFGNYSEGYEEGFIEGAKWADRTMMERVCNWLKQSEDDYYKYNAWKGCYVDFDALIEDLKKEWNYVFK